MEKSSGIGTLKGIGAKTEQLFHNLGVYTIGDILLHYPKDYDKLPPITPLEEISSCLETTAAIAVRIDKAPFVRAGRNMQVTSLAVKAQDVKAEFVWFRMPYLRNTLKVGEWFVFLGKVAQKGTVFHMEQPQIYTPEKYESMQNCLWPSYPLTAGLKKNRLSQTIRQALEELDLSVDYLPEEVRARHGLAEYNYALENIHFPENETALEQARKRLVFDEFFKFILAAGMQKEQMEEVPNSFVFPPLHMETENPDAKKQEKAWADLVMEELPFCLTEAQKRTLLEIRQDLRGRKVMQRLVQGDVGSGKTIIAFLSMLDAAQAGYQSALMAPTEVLAMQHYQTFTELFERYGLKIPVILLTGSLTAKEKRHVYERMQLYHNAMIIGTHALIQERALYDNLALVITDEQHRFGVKQRETLFLRLM